MLSQENSDLKVVEKKKKKEKKKKSGGKLCGIFTCFSPSHSPAWQQSRR